MSITADQVAEYLRSDPKFFENHAALLAELYLPSLHGNSTISLAQRQQLAQRDKIRILEAKLSELIQFGEENDATSERVHRLSLGLLAACSLDALLSFVIHNFREDFRIPHVTLRLWEQPRQGGVAIGEEFACCNEELILWTLNLPAPYCGHLPPLDLGFGTTTVSLQSCALIPLRGESTFGLLGLASEDPRRFYPEMGTLYLKRIGELVSVALLRHLL